MPSFLDFEKPIAELEGKIAELRHLANAGDMNIAEEIARLQAKAEKLLRQTYGKLSAWQKTQVARHQERPHFFDYVGQLIDDYVPLAGDRSFADDKAIQGGLGRLRGIPVLILGHEKGSDTATRVRHNFGMAKPEGYRKAVRLLELADRFKLPVVTLVDTPGAYPGVEAEARGQAEAIARSIEACLKVKSPVVSAIIGEGGSGGAIALAAANHIIMLEHSVYSVISPEGCASILWRSAENAQDAAEALKLTAGDLKSLGVIDEIVSEPLGGAHRGKEQTIAALGDAIERALQSMQAQDGTVLREQRRDKFLEMGRRGLAA
ncbi:MAG: acetyl-CoA carboxylase carboxyltransferase subunit alpha [Rhodospirillaceae bacterium]|jgi:acetyl-CoA carboxylase carboxyl transferase subunit alpha|nr:acetyl-CoA carboxylase carboxyltransferase subunit alpha [Rhodospirillaceae bacterium]